ncbi:MAG: TMEM175 family protein [Vicinamibacterales bacterium]
MTLDRRHEITRLEAFSDAVFAFALTLLVVSLEVPRSYEELILLVRGFLPFACCFALLIWIWYEHSAFFTRYRIHDRLAVVLNASLLFVVLFYVYPLKYVFNEMFSFMLPHPEHAAVLTPGELANIFTIYGIGYASVFVLFAMLYHHAWRRRVVLRLDPAEAYEARLEMGGQLVSAAIGLLAAAWAVFAPRQYAVVSISGFIYMLMGPAHATYGAWEGRRRRAFARAAHASTEA